MIHWNVFEKRWTSRTYKSCGRFDQLLVLGEWKTEVKKEKKENPRGWVYADHTQVVLNPSEQELNLFEKDEQLLYDKHEMEFNIEEGVDLLFNLDGCFLIHKIG